MVAGCLQTEKLRQRLQSEAHRQQLQAEKIRVHLQSEQRRRLSLAHGENARASATERSQGVARCGRAAPPAESAASGSRIAPHPIACLRVPVTVSSRRDRASEEQADEHRVWALAAGPVGSWVSDATAGSSSASSVAKVLSEDGGGVPKRANLWRFSMKSFCWRRAQATSQRGTSSVRANVLPFAPGLENC